MMNIDGVIFGLAKVIGLDKLSLGLHSQIDDFCFINTGKRCEIGRNVHISSFPSIIGGGECIIEDFAGLSAGCRIITGSDDFSGPYLTNPTVPSEFKKVNLDKVIIRKHVVLGTNCIVFPGVEIGEGATVSAGAVVRKTLEPWTVYAVIKGKLIAIKKRDGKAILAKEKQYKDKENKC